MTRVRFNPVGWLFVAPALFLLIVWLVYPTLWTIRLSFYGGPGFVATRFVGLDNFLELFTPDPSFFHRSHLPPPGAVVHNLLRLVTFGPLSVCLGPKIALP